jgi:hypothetical protein
MQRCFDLCLTGRVVVKMVESMETMNKTKAWQATDIFTRVLGFQSCSSSAASLSKIDSDDVVVVEIGDDGAVPHAFSLSSGQNLHILPTSFCSR